MTTTCRKKYMQEYYLRNKEKILAQTKKYAQEHPEVRRAVSVRWRARNPEKVKSRNDAYYKDHPKRNDARIQVRYAVAAGRLAPWPCWICGEEKVEAHHPDYDAPLAVVWLCRSHHQQIHAEVQP